MTRWPRLLCALASCSASRRLRLACGDRGFTLVEVLVAAVILMFGLVVVGAMFPMGYTQVVNAGTMTSAVTATRRILEDAGSIAFDDLATLNGFDTDAPGTVPATEPARTIARRWRYAIAGDGDGFVFTEAEKARWAGFVPPGGRATVQITQPSATLRQVTVTVSVQASTVQLTTLIARMW
jgi:prepilin-type N-terminal cleavage/methylation domain-containing protein